MNKIRLVLLTGFLGAGKTTLMTALLNAYKNERIGVIVNEFGSVNIDAVLIRRDGIQMAELSNGSIFCSCIKENFLSSLVEMSKKELDYVFIEASGLADPASMAKILDGIAPKTERAYDYKGALCVIDAENFLELFELLPALEHQVEYSGTSIINKADLASHDRIVEISDTIGKLNPGAQVFVTSYCRVDIRSVIENLSPVTREAVESTNTVESRPKTVVLNSEKRLPKAALDGFLEDVAPETFRIKGFSETDSGNLEISAVGRHINYVDWPDKVDGTELVLISSVGIKLLSSIKRALERHFQGELHF